MDETDSITNAIIRAAIRVHQRYGPGLLESVYTPCLAHELLDAGHSVDISKPLPLKHGSLDVPRAFLLDLLVDERVVVEVKCVDSIAPIHVAQLVTYLRLSDLEVGLILNFNVVRMKEGIRRVVNNYRGDKAVTG